MIELQICTVCWSNAGKTEKNGILAKIRFAEENQYQFELVIKKKNFQQWLALIDKNFMESLGEA